MGCGASNNNIVTTPTPVDSAAIAPNTNMANLDVLQKTTGNLQSKFDIFLIEFLVQIHIKFLLPVIRLNKRSVNG
jgi:hypothetical protein